MRPLVQALRRGGHRVVTTSNSQFAGKRRDIGWTNSSGGLFQRYRGVACALLAMRLAYRSKPTDVANFGAVPNIFSAGMVFSVSLIALRRRVILS